MPRFFFDIRQKHNVLSDTERSELPDLRTAEREALISLLQLLADCLRGSGPIEIQQIEVLDATGQILAVVQLEDAVRSLR